MDGWRIRLHMLGSLCSARLGLGKRDDEDEVRLCHRYLSRKTFDSLILVSETVFTIVLGQTR